MITIVDYGLGNVRAFLNVYRRLNIEAGTARTPGELAGASKLILPGVGAFDNAMDRLNESGMREALDELVLSRRVPVLGVCVGMQMLARSSDEGIRPGLGWIEGSVKGFAGLPAATPLPVPHMGWNDVRCVGRSPLLEGLDATARFYFLHSYYFHCEREGDGIATTAYGIEFACAVNAENIFGVQFHPEKSHRSGTRVLQNFAEL
jgi:glutamine amidotransferase